jgi:hypothetical protein
MAREKGSTLRFLRDPALGPYQIQLDEHCYIAQKITTSESGNEYINVLGHFAKLNAALKSIAVDELKSDSYESLKDYITEYNKITQRLENLTEL